MDDPQARDSAATATRELQPGERLLWSGSSDQSVLFTPRDAFLVPFSVLWICFVLFLLSNAVATTTQPVFFVVFAVFIVIGLHMLFGRFLVKRHRKRTTVYAVTDRRAFMTNGRRTRETPANRTDRTITWSRDREHCSVQWEEDRGSRFASWNNSRRMYANTGLDGITAPLDMAFWDVRDGEGLTRALEQAAQPQRR